MNRKKCVLMKGMAIMATVAMLTGMAACGTAGNGGSSVSGVLSAKEAEVKKLNMDDISWSVDEGIVDKKRRVLLSYTNNSDYVITDFEITFSEKSGISEEDRNSYYEDVRKILNASDSDMEELKQLAISMHCDSKLLTNAKESNNNSELYYYSGYYYVTSINHYNLVEPDIAVISYIDDGKINKMSYDFKSKKATYEAGTEAAYEWTTNDIGNKVPKPEFSRVELTIDRSDDLSFYAYGVSLDKYNEYVSACKERGFTVDSYGYSTSYSANDSEGYKISLRYDDDEMKMSCMLDAPSK